ncbi:MAG TPA: tripartite tricarboxylate transporter TctB family protein [Oxalicibacterium sp.]|nr:tripartite tricarboxylate transporter TctB family protein [Oxalicibacterium sp.]
MPSFIRHPKDFWTGIIFLIVGLAAVIIGRNYPMGTAGRMGPAYFPTVLGGLLALIGLAAAIRSFLHDGEPIGKFALKETALIIGAVLLFGFLIRGGGMIVAVIAIVLLSARASCKFKWRYSVPLAVGLAAFAVLVFVKLLGLPIPILGPWFGAWEI